MKKRDTTRLIDALVQRYGATTISLVLDAFKDLGFKYATQAGITISKNDVVVPPSKPEILGRYEDEVAEIQDQYDQGLITQEERHEAVVELWNACTDEVADAMIANLDELNPIFMMANSGARGSFKQIRQLAGMRGLMANPKGEIIERPIKANFVEGLSVLEYFISTHGARKGLADTALRTADSGYLTRRLVDVAQDVIIREADCGTEEYIEMPVFKDGRRAQRQPDRAHRRARVHHQARAHARRAGRRRSTARSSPTSSRATATTTTAAPGRDGRGALGAQVRGAAGVCQACYGRAMATGQIAQIGDAVGIIAAQSIGEPGTQLTMRTFHTGGVAGADITHGLPRVVELFEARKPKGLAKIAEQDGVISIEESDKALTVVITDEAGEEHRHTFPRRTRLYVTSGREDRGGQAAQRGLALPARAARDARAHRDRAVPRQGGAGGLQVPGRGHQRQAHRADRAPDAQEGARRPEGRHRLPARPVRRPLRVRAGQRRAGRQDGGETAEFEDIILGITKASLNTDSFLSAASFQETTKVLTDAALEGKIDRLNGLKENVIIGKLIPAATGLKRYRRIEIEPAEPLPRAIDEVGLLDQEEIAAELGLHGGDALGAGYGRSSTPTSPRWRRSAPATPTRASSRSWPSSRCPRSSRSSGARARCASVRRHHPQ